jgi:hypothetical protein
LSSNIRGGRRRRMIIIITYAHIHMNAVTDKGEEQKKETIHSL